MFIFMLNHSDPDTDLDLDMPCDGIRAQLSKAQLTAHEFSKCVPVLPVAQCCGQLAIVCGTQLRLIVGPAVQQKGTQSTSSTWPLSYHI